MTRLLVAKILDFILIEYFCPLVFINSVSIIAESGGIYSEKNWFGNLLAKRSVPKA